MGTLRAPGRTNNLYVYIIHHTEEQQGVDWRRIIAESSTTQLSVWVDLALLCPRMNFALFICPGINSALTYPNKTDLALLCLGIDLALLCPRISLALLCPRISLALLCPRIDLAPLLCPRINLGLA